MQRGHDVLLPAVVRRIVMYLTEQHDRLAGEAIEHGLRCDHATIVRIQPLSRLCCTGLRIVRCRGLLENTDRRGERDSENSDWKIQVK